MKSAEITNQDGRSVLVRTCVCVYAIENVRNAYKLFKGHAFESRTMASFSFFASFPFGTQ